MAGCTRKMWFSLIFCSLYFSLSSAFDLRKLELLDNNINGFNEKDDSDEHYFDSPRDPLDINVGAIIGIAIGTIVVLFLLPILLCFCCACCCFRNRRNKSSVVTVVAAPVVPQNVPQQYGNADVHNHIATAQTYGSTNDASQNAFKDNIGFSVYPGSGDNLNATQTSNQYYNYNSSGVPAPGPSSTNNDQSHIYEQPPPYYEVAVQSTEQHQTGSNQTSKSTTTDKN